MDKITRAVQAFDAQAFVKRHGGHKESPSDRSHEYLLECPFCHGHNLRWNARKGTGAWVCWNCKKTGDTIFLIQIFERCDREDAIKYLFDGYTGGDANLFLSEIASMPGPMNIERLKLKRLPTMLWPAMVAPVTREHASAYAYLIGRGITGDQIANYHIGIGLGGWLKNYVVFPVYMDNGLVYWQARATWNPPAGLSKEARKCWIEATRYRKNLNPMNPPKGVAQATAADVLYNYDYAKGCSHIVICEGPVDAIKVGAHAVALLGKGTDIKIERLRKMNASRYTVYLDRGKEEREKAEWIASELSGFAPTFIATPPEGYDAGALSFEQNSRIIERAESVGEIGLQSDLRL
jgi:hypothetical protein